MCLYDQNPPNAPSTAVPNYGVCNATGDGPMQPIALQPGMWKTCKAVHVQNVTLGVDNTTFARQVNGKWTTRCCTANATDLVDGCSEAEEKAGGNGAA